MHKSITDTSFVLYVVFLVLFNISHITAQTDTLYVDNIFALSLDELINVKVTTANKRAESLIETPSYTLVLTEEDLKILNFNTLEEVFDYFVGSQSIRAEGNMFTTTTFRGNTLTHYNVNSLLLFDGVPLYNMYNGSFDMSIIPLSSIKQVEILKGSNSVLYGTNAMNATINIIPKESAKEELAALGRIRYGSYNTIAGQNALYGKSKKLSYGIFADFQMGEGEVIDYTLKDGNTDFQLQNAKKVGAIAGYVEWNKLKFNIHSLNRSLYHIDNNMVDTVYYFADADVYSIVFPNNADEYQNLFSLSYENDFSEKLSLNLRSCYQFYNLYQQVNRKKQHYHSHGYFNEAELAWSPGKQANLIFGVHYNWYIGHRHVETVKNGVKESGYDVAPNKKPTNDIAFYLNGNYKFKKLNFFYGGRYYISNYEEHYTSNFSPRLALTYDIKPDLNLKVIYGKSFRVPGYFEKGSTSLTAYGNPNLEPETSNSFDIVVSGKKNRFNYTADVFASNISNKIVREVPSDEDLDEVGEDISLIYKNSSGALFLGAEFSAKYYISHKLSTFFGYSYVDAKNEDDDPAVLGDDLWFFYHMVNGGVRYKLFPFMAFNASARAISDWGPAPGNVVVNFGLSMYPVVDSPFSIELLVNNLFSEQVFMPEIANRDIDVVPYTMKTQSRWFFISLNYGF